MLKLWAPASARGTAAARCRLRIATDLSTFPIDALAGEAILPAGVKHVYHGRPLTTGAIGRKAVQVTNAGRLPSKKLELVRYVGRKRRRNRTQVNAIMSPIAVRVYSDVTASPK
jgi:hypothetical protein